MIVDGAWRSWIFKTHQRRLLASRQRQPDLGVDAPITTADWAIWVSAVIAEPAA